ncbi:sugar transferase [Tetragenococcus halophilus]|uniref:sugar transferase n=1 Tax=Tetragenococcus halophilus TaxID=51669 RepID=UPI002A924EFC|nr:hypothetical protein TEHSL10_05280 [Tetragenococcus halophilus]
MVDLDNSYEIDEKLEKNYIKEIVLNRDKIDKKHTYHFITRLIDIFGSLVGLIFLFPVFLIVAFMIKKEEPTGKIFYSQMRVGKNGNKFRMYKFRSMCMNADEKLVEILKLNEVEGAMFKVKDDPRITKVGKFIRKTSIDELPQFWNVLKGDMSIVGPRPPLLREVKQYSIYDKQRLVKSKILCKISMSFIP